MECNKDYPKFQPQSNLKTIEADFHTKYCSGKLSCVWFCVVLTLVMLEAGGSSVSGMTHHTPSLKHAIFPRKENTHIA